MRGFNVRDGIGFQQNQQIVSDARRTLPSTYFSPVESMAAGDTQRMLLQINLDPALAPVWSIVVLGQPRGGAVAPANNFAMAIGRLFIAGGGGGGLNDRAIPFDIHDVTILTVPAANIRLSVDCSLERITGIPASRGDGVFSAYAVPYAFERANAYYSEFSTTVAPAATFSFGIGTGANAVIAAAQDATQLVPCGDSVFVTPILNQAYFLDIGNPALNFTRWSIPGANTAGGPGWYPRQAGSDGFTRVFNNGASNNRYVATHRLKI